LSLISATIIAFNWGLYIWAVTHGYVLQTSLGYFINPLLSVLLGVVLLGEKLSSSQILAVILAALGCASMLFFVGEFPWLALLLSTSFAIYGFMRKVSALGSILGLALETLLLSPLAVAYLWYCNTQGNLSFGHSDVRTDIVLVCAGFVTAIPLLLFAESARRIPLSVLGILQYIAPSCQFCLALFVYRENFTVAHFVSFGLSVSSSQTPSLGYKEALLVNARNVVTRNNLSSKELETCIVGVNIFYRTNMVSMIVESASVELGILVANFGGILDFFLWVYQGYTDL
jgi:chloramphenicol-sensitive protein RarD